MTLAANTKNIEWLIDRMYTARREMQANNVSNPVFALFTKDAADRAKVEEIILRHLLTRYGDFVAKGTFGTRPEGEWFHHLLPKDSIVTCEFLDEKIKEAQARGDRVVRCLIETSENVKVTLLKAP